MACDKPERIWSNPNDPNAEINPDEWAPSNLVTLRLSSNAIVLSWEYERENISGFKLDRKINNNDWVLEYAVMEQELREWTDTLAFVSDSISYYYRLYAYTGSNVSSYNVDMFDENAPQPVDITSVTYDTENMTVEWEIYPDEDFSFYLLLTSDSEDGLFTIVDTVTDVNTTSYSINEFNPLIENWFRMRVTNNLGLSEVGNGMTNEIDTPPTVPQIDSIIYENDSFIINWLQNNDDDFQSYTLYESQSADMSSQTEVFTSENNTETSYTVTGVSENEIRYYQIVVEDIWGLQSDSVVDNFGFITDIDGNVYQIVQIGDQVWMAENLKVTHYRNGDEIPTGYSNSEWEDLNIWSRGAYAVYGDNPANADVYGYLYNWYALDDIRNIAPEGWHVATDAEYTALSDYLGGESVAGGKMKDNVNWNGTNESGFSALPGGLRSGDTGNYQFMGEEGQFWTSELSKMRYLHNDAVSINIYLNSSTPQLGASIRCVSD